MCHAIFCCFLSAMFKHAPGKAARADKAQGTHRADAECNSLCVLFARQLWLLCLANPLEHLLTCQPHLDALLSWMLAVLRLVPNASCFHLHHDMKSR